MAASVTMRPFWLLSSFAPCRLMSPAALTTPPALFRSAPPRSMPASLSSLPPRLSRAPARRANSRPALETAPARLSTLPALRVRVPWLSRAPLPLLSSAPASCSQRFFWLLSRPPWLLSRLCPMTVSPSRPARVPARLAMRCTCRFRPASPITLPAPLSRLSAWMSTLARLEISPPWLSRSVPLTVTPLLAATRPPLRLSSCLASRLSAPWASSSPPCWLKLSALACRSPLAVMLPLVLFTWPAVRSSAAPLSRLPPWLLSNWPTSSFRSPRLLITPSTLLFRLVLDRMTPASPTTSPPRLSRLPACTPSAPLAESKPSAWLSSFCWTRACSVPLLTRVPLPLLSRLSRVKSSACSAENRPRRLSSAPPLTCRRLATAWPLRLSRRAASRFS
ncbi:hypothetical protein D3C76_930050 [compost metagenome]